MTMIETLPTAKPTTECTEHTFTTFDNEQLFYRHWQPAEPSDRALILFHRGHEHSGRFDELVQRLDLPACHVFAWDARGHGQSPGDRGYAENFSVIIRDIDCFIRFISTEYSIPFQNMIVLGHSVGAVAVAAWVHDYAPQIRAMMLATPALRVKLYIPFALPALRFRNVFGRSSVTSYVKAKMLTHDPVEAKKYETDPLISRTIATNILLDLHDTATRLLADAGAIATPTLVLCAGSDWVVQNTANRKFFNGLSSSVKEFVEYPGFYHSILHERDREKPITKIREFFDAAFARKPSPSPGTPGEGSQSAVQQRFTQKEFESLSRPLPLTSPKRWNFAAQRLNLKTLCKLSQGIRLGWRTGFDSGETLDYVYRNSPGGFSPLGKLIDYFYLNSIGWTGIRIRKTNLQDSLRECIRAVQRSGEMPRIVDIAAGAGRYTLEVLGEFKSQNITALLRDHSGSALQAARQNADTMNLTNVTFEIGDAFDPDSLRQITPRPSIAIVSGLYELFPSNKPIEASLRGLADILPEGCHLIYTNQPWHPQIEMIARVLSNRDGKPWIMRRRTQAEMDELVRSAGFEKQSMLIDKYGLFTVSIARRIQN